MRVTVAQLKEAAKKNGFIHGKGHWFRTKNWKDYPPNSTTVGSKNTPITKACFMGQVAINLGVEGDSLQQALNLHFGNLGEHIITWNDTLAYSYDKIFELVKEELKNYSDDEVLVLRKAKYYAKRKDETNA